MKFPVKRIQTGINNPILRHPSEEIFEIEKDLQEFCDTLMLMMWKHDGVGLAAPQVGQNIRVIATSQREERPKKNKLLWTTIMINPTIIDKSKETILWEEACISLPGATGIVRRHKHIQVEFLTPEGKKQKQKYKDFNAVIIQHEMDHLDGILFMDKVEPEKKKVAKK